VLSGASTAEEEGSPRRSGDFSPKPSNWELRTRGRLEVPEEDADGVKRDSSSSASRRVSTPKGNINPNQKHSEWIKQRNAAKIAQARKKNQSHHHKTLSEYHELDEANFDQVTLLHSFFGDPKPKRGQLFGDLPGDKGMKVYIVEEIQDGMWFLVKKKGSKSFGYIAGNYLTADGVTPMCSFGSR